MLTKWIRHQRDLLDIEYQEEIDLLQNSLSELTPEV